MLIEKLIGADDRHVAFDCHRIVPLQDRIKHFRHRNLAPVLYSLLKHFPLNQARVRHQRKQAEKLPHFHTRPPFGILADLKVCCIHAQDHAKLFFERCDIFFNHSLREHRPRGILARRIPDARGKFTQDNHGFMPRILQSAYLPERGRVADMQIRRRRINTELDAQSASGFQRPLHLLTRHNILHPAGKQFGL